MTFKVKDGLSVGANTILDSIGNLTLPAGAKATLSNTTTAGASLNLGTGTADPTTPATGDVWNNTGVLKIRQAAATKTIAYLDSTITGNAANVTGTVAIANGGTNGSATPTAGAVPYGTGTAFGFTAAGTSGQYLTSAGTGVPVWVTLPTTIANATNVGITDDVATATSQYLYFGSATSGNTPVKSSSTRLTFVPSTGNLTTIGSVTVGGNGVVFGGSTSGTTNVKASAIAGTTTITLPATTGTVVTTGDTGTVTSTMILDGTILNADINASAAIAVSKLAASTISGVTLGGTLAALTISTGLTGTSYNGSTAATIALAASGVTAGSYGTATSIPSITVDTYGRITAASGNAITIGTGTLTAAIPSAGATNTTVALSFDGAFDANSTANRTISPVVGPAITALAATMTGATTGILAKTAADTYSLVTNISTATTLQTARNIQGVSFNGSADITVVTAGTGVSVAGTAVSIGQAVAASSNVQFNSIGVGVAASAVTGTITGTSFNSITGLSSTAPIVAGTATVGTGTTVARADHIHPVQTTVSGNAGGLSATLVATSGGTGQSAYAVGDILYASTTTALSKLADVAVGNALISGGLNTAPSWGKIGLTTHISGTLGIANGGTGATTAADALTALGGTTVGVNFFDLVNPSAITFPRINADNTVSALDAASFRVAIGATTGTVTSVGGTGTVSGLSLSGTVTTSGNLTLGGTLAVDATNFASQTAATFLAAPTGTAGVPTFRVIAAADVPTLNQNTTGNAGTVTNGVYTNAANTLTNQLTLSSAAPILNFFETDQVLPAGRRRLVLDGNIFSLRRNTAAGGDFSTEVYDIQSDASGNFTALGNVTAYSDIRLKKDLVQIPNALDKVQQLTGYTYTRTDTGEKHTGLVAQDVQKVIPEAVIEGEYLSVAYGNLVGLLVEAIKELRAEVAALKGDK